MSIEENKRICLEYMRLMAIGELDAAAQLEADDFQAWILGKGVVSRSKFHELVRANVHSLNNKSMALRIGDITAEQDRVCIEAESLAVRENGSIYNNQYHILYKLRDGKLLLEKEYMDTEHVAEYGKGTSVARESNLWNVDESKILDLTTADKIE